MAESNFSDTIIGYSKTPEATFASISITESDYKAVRTKARNLPTSDPEKTTDLGYMGGNVAGMGEFATQTFNGVRKPPAFDVSSEVNVNEFLVYLKRFSGGTDTVSVVEATKAWKHTIGMLNNTGATGLQLPSTSWIFSNNGLDYIYGGNVGNTLAASQQGVSNPEFVMGWLGSGYARKISTISGPSFGVIDAPTAKDIMLGPETDLRYTDDAGTVVLTATQRMKNWSLNANNAQDTSDLRAGLPRVTSADPIDGWYRSFILHNDRTAGAEVRVTVDAAMNEKRLIDKNIPVTNFKITTKGYFVTASTVNQYSVTFIFKKAQFSNGRPVEDSGRACFDFDVTSLDPLDGSFGVLWTETVNASSVAVT